MSKYFEQQINKLFEQSQKNSGIEYIYTLLRVTGIGEGPDELFQFYESLENLNFNTDYLSVYSSIIKSEELFSLLVNLIRCSNKENYIIKPFLHLYKRDIHLVAKPSALEIVNETIKIARKSNNKRFSEIIQKTFSKEILCLSSMESIPCKSDSDIKECLSFVKVFLRLYFEERLKFHKGYKIYKLPRFEVLELLTNEKIGLYGFKMHFSNDQCAYFIRNLDNTDILNVILGDPVNFMIGNSSTLKEEWRLGGKRLYEVGLPGRYNKLGEWKPLIYPASFDSLRDEALKVSDDDNVQGAYFYMLCTGHKIIEFVVNTTLELPMDLITFGSSLHLWKSPSQNKKEFIKTETNNFFHIYDGWVDLESGSIEEIEITIRSIGLVLDIIGFTFGVAINWRLKYKMLEHIEPIASPSKEDLDILDLFMKNITYEGNDAAILSYAIDWYVKGRTTRNVFLRFLSYYIAFESIAVAIAEGDAKFGLDYKPESKAERRQRQEECINSKFETLYKIDPVKFVREAYFDCVVGISNKTKKAAELVFGTDNEFLEWLFVKKSGDISLNDIRGKLAHGDIALLNKDDERLVRERIHQIEIIAKEFLIRIILKLKPTEPIPVWSYEHKAVFTTADPRSTFCCSDLSIFPKGTDWTLRAEWCDE